MNGSLSDKFIPEILNTLRTGSHSGTLEVCQPGTEKKIYFENGTICFAEGSLPEDDFGEFLIQIGKLSPAQLDEARAISPKAGHLIETLLQMQLFTQEQLRQFLETHIPEVIYPLFDWSSGVLRFGSGTPPLPAKLRLGLSTAGIIFEGIRRLKRPEIINKAVGPSNKWIRLTPRSEADLATLTIKPDEAYILSRVESPIRISEVLQLSPLGLEVTQRALYAFLCTGIVEFSNDQENHAVFEKVGIKADQQRISSEFLRSQDNPEKSPEREPLQLSRSEILSKLEDSRSKTYYELLNVPVSANIGEIKNAYHELAKKFHPDRHHQLDSPELRSALETIFAALAQAYETLKIPATRAAYDAKTLRADTLTEQPSEKTESLKTASASPGTPPQKLAELNYLHGRTYFDKRDYWNAVQAFRQCVRFEPDHARYRYWLGMALSKNPKWVREAEEHFLRAIQLENLNPAYYVGLGLLYKEVGMPRRAEAQIRQALVISPTDAAALEALENLGGRINKESTGLNSIKKLFGRK